MPWASAGGKHVRRGLDLKRRPLELILFSLSRCQTERWDTVEKFHVSLFSGDFSPKRTLTLYFEVGSNYILHLCDIYRLRNCCDYVLLLEEEPFYIYRVSSSDPTHFPIQRILTTYRTNNRLLRIMHYVLASGFLTRFGISEEVFRINSNHRPFSVPVPWGLSYP